MLLLLLCLQDKIDYLELANEVHNEKFGEYNKEIQKELEHYTFVYNAIKEQAEKLKGDK